MKYMKAFLILLFTVQFAIPIWMIIGKEIVLKKGDIIKFQVEPVGPYDAFRGKYLSIRIKGNALFTETENYRKNQKVNVLIKIDSEGFGSPEAVLSGSETEQPYIECTINYIRANYIRLNFPFDRYYINEDYSQLGEDLYNQYSRGEKEDAYIVVRVNNGKAVLEGMYLSGVEINQFIKSKLNEG